MESNFCKWDAERWDCEEAGAATSDPGDMSTTEPGTGEKCFSADNIVMKENGNLVTIDELKIADRIATRFEDGEYVFNQVSFLKKKDVGPAIRIVTETSWVGLAWKHYIITQNGWEFAQDVNIGDEIRMESGRWEKVVDIEHYAELMYSVRTTDLHQEILVNGLCALENSDGDEQLLRQIYNFFTFKVLGRSKYLATFGHHFERLSNGIMVSSAFIAAILAARQLLGVDSKVFKQE